MKRKSVIAPAAPPSERRSLAPSIGSAVQVIAAGGVAGAIVAALIGATAASINRPTIEAAIEILIVALDEIDGDTDREPDAGEEREPEEDFEPSLGWSLTGAINWRDVHPNFHDMEEWFTPVGRAA